MELDAEPGQLAMLSRHHEPVLGPGRELEVGGQVVPEHDEGVIAARFERARDAVEDPASFVMDEGRLPMERGGAIDGSAARDAQRLVPEAHAEDGDPLGKQAEQVREGARVARVTGAGGEHDGLRFTSHEVGGRRLVRLHDLGRVPESLDQLDEVVGEAVVVVYYEDSHCAPMYTNLTRGGRVRLIGLHRKGPDLAAYIEDHLSTSFDLRENTLYRYRVDLRTHVVPYLGDIPVGKLTVDDVRGWLRKLQEVGATPAAIRSARTALGRVLTGAVKEGLLVASPLGAIPWNRVTHREVRPLTTEEVDRIADVIYPRWRAAIYVAAYGGLRIGELAGLRQEDIHLASGRLAVRRAYTARNGVSEPKTAAGRRTVTLPRFVAEELAQHLLNHPPIGGFVFTTRTGGHLTSKIIHREWKLALEKAAVRLDTHFHDLRHTAASLAIASGANARSVQARLGHAKVQTTLSTYTHLFGHEDDAIAEALDREHRQVVSRSTSEERSGKFT